MASLIDRVNSINAPRKQASTKSYTGGNLWYAGSPVNRDLRSDEYGAAQAVAIVTEVQRAVKFWEQWLSGLTWHVYDGKTDAILTSSADRKPPTGAGAMWFNAMQRFSRQWKHDFFESIAFSDWVYGETFIGKLRNQVQAADFMWLNPLATEPMILSGKIDYYQYQSDDPQYPYRIDPQHVAFRIAQRNPFDDLRGNSPVITAINDINIVENAKQALINYYRKGMQLGGVVSGKPSTEGAWSVDGNTLDEIKEQMARGNKGVQNFYEWFFSNAPVDINQFQPIDIEKNYAIIEPLRKQIAFAMGVPPVLSGDPTEVNYDNADKVMKNWWQTDGIPYATKIAKFTNDDLLPSVEPNTDIYFGFDFAPFQIEDPETVSTDFTAQYIPINVAQKKRGYEVDERLDGVYIIGGKPMHADIIAQIAKQLPPEYAQAQQPAPVLPATLPQGEPVTEEPALPAVTEEPVKKYDPSQPRDGDGQFGSGGGSSSGGGNSGGGDSSSSDSSGDKPSGGDKPSPKKPSKPEKPKKGKPDWAKKENRTAGKDPEGYQDYGNVMRNPKNGDANTQIRAMSDQQVANLDKKQQNAVTTYTGESYQDINGGLREGKKLNATQQRTVDNLDAALSKNSLSEDTVLYRGMRMTPELETQLTTGATFTDSAYTSASFDQTMGDSFARGALMRVKAPAGTNGLSVASISNFPPESEFLLPRNTQYRITGVSKDSKGQFYIDAEIIGSDGKSKWVRYYLNPYKQEPEQKPETDRSDKFSWGIEDIVFDEPIEGESDSDSEPADDETETPDTEKHAHSPTVETWDYTPSLARKELAAWQRHIKAKSARPFEPRYTRGDIADLVTSGLASGADMIPVFDSAFALLPSGLDSLKSAFIAVFDAVQADDDITATKSVQSIRLDFEGRFADVLNDIRSGNVDNRRRAGDILRQLIRTFGYRAYVQGLQDGGVMDNPSEEDEAEIASIRSEQSSYVSNITRVLISGDGVTDTQAAGKPELWFNKTIIPFYQAGLASANSNGLYEWRYGFSEHCSDCLRLNGQRHRLKHWKGKGWLPQAKKLECGGFNCQCQLIPASGKAVGKF
jgi:hypothetical protein